MTSSDDAPGAKSGPPTESKHKESTARVDSARSNPRGKSNGRSFTGRECSNKYCYAPETPCHLGSLDPTACDNWQPSRAKNSVPSTADYRPPWSGLALGSADLNAVAGTGRPRVVALIGAPNAGKTSALAAYFIGLRCGHATGGLHFAGSFTLLGWDQIAHHAELPPGGSRGFPPHTTSGRLPALLHVRLASDTRRFYDVYFTDVPGEWFDVWASEANEAPGAQWIADRADLFVVLSDSDALSGPDRGLARNSYQTLASRISSVANEREVYPVRAKADLSVPDVISRALEQTDTESFGVAAAPLSVIAGSPISDPLHPLDELIQKVTAPRCLARGEATRLSDPFLGFRERLVLT